jgi:hypothetical protein
VVFERRGLSACASRTTNPFDRCALPSAGHDAVISGKGLPMLANKPTRPKRLKHPKT